MDPLEYWALCPTFSIVQAAFLFCGRDPSHIDRHSVLQAKYQPDGYIPVRTALLNAVAAGLLPAQVRYELYDDGPSDVIDIHETEIARRDLENFFADAPVQGYFFGQSGRVSDLARSSAPLPPKLNAAFRAWVAVTTDPRLQRGKSPKQALKAWLVEHASELGLLKRDGGLNETGIEDICKVANWKPEGGATPTPGPENGVGPTLVRPPRPPEGAKVEAPWMDADDEIPF